VLRMGMRSMHDPLNYAHIAEFAGTADTTCSAGEYETAAVANDGLWDDLATSYAIDDATDTQGLSRLFVRAHAVAADGPASMELRFNQQYGASSTVIYTDGEPSPFSDDDAWVMVDCGILDESGRFVPEAYLSDELIIRIQGRYVDSGTDIRCDYAMRMPVDESYLTFPTGLRLLGNVEDRELWIDTISPRPTALLILDDAPLAPAAYRGKLPYIRPNVRTRVFFSFDRAAYLNYIQDQLTVKVYLRPQYLTLAGY